MTPDHSDLYRQFLAWRDIETPCKRCGGTATLREAFPKGEEPKP